GIEEAPFVEFPEDVIEVVPEEPILEEEPVQETEPKEKAPVLEQEPVEEDELNSSEPHDDEVLVELIGDNPGNLPGPIIIDPPVFVWPSVSSSLMSLNELVPPPGGTNFSKVAMPVEGMVNTWDVIVRMEGRDTTQTSDIVLVLDASNSMNENGRMAAAKTAAKQFINTLLPDGNTTNRIAIVEFASRIFDTVEFKGATEKQTLLNAVDAIYANHGNSGGTFTQAGMRQAKIFIEASQADFKNIVLLSDGEPTYSYELSDPDSYVEQYQTNPTRYETKPAPQSAYNYSGTSGNGTSFRTQYKRVGWPWEYYDYNHGSGAIAEAGFAKAQSMVYTIALEAGTTGTNVLNSMASPGKAYTATPSDLNRILSEIAGSIGAAINNATVEDPMGLGFEIPAGEVTNISVTQGSAQYNTESKTINWDLEGSVRTPVSGDSSLKYAELTYRIEINDDILNATPNGDLYKTNGDTVLSYVDANGVSQEHHFISPEVDPILLIVEKQILDSLGNEIDPDSREFTINVNNGEDGDYDKDYVVVVGTNGRKVLTNLRYEQNYSVSETDVSSGALEDYETTITVNDELLDTFSVQQGDSDRTILVTNKENPLGKLTVVKEFINTPSLSESRVGTLATEPLKFSFKVTGPNDFLDEFDLSAGDQKVLEGLHYGAYKVEEITTGYNTTYSPEGGEVTLSFDEREATVTVTNQVTQNESVVAKKQWVGELQDNKPDVWFKLYRESIAEEKAAVEGAEVKQVPVGPGAEFTVTWEDMPEYDSQGNPYTYSVKEVYEDGSNLIPAGYRKYEEGLTVRNEFLPVDTANITSIKFTKEWIGVTPGTNPTITVEVYNKTTGETVRTAQLTYPDTTLEWKNLPHTDDEGNIIDYGIREANLNGFEPSEPTEIDSSIDTISYYPSQSSIDWDIGHPSFVITRTTKNGPFVIWTLNHLPETERMDFLQNVFAAAGDNPNQPIKDLKNNYQTTPIIWIEGPEISHDIFPPEDNGYGLISINVTFNADGSIASSNLSYEGQSTWTHFAVGTYASKEVTITNTYKATGQWEPIVTKILSGGGRILRPGEFTFQLRDAEGNVLQTKTNAADGSVTFDPIQY
ncbi:MAG: VWA domain-containing protein, partial [Erysipelothrix sp.]|nr:VWA domain-containing protein [Erysipelothrix sp.]